MENNPQGARFPVARPRRLRKTAALRRMVAETGLSVNDLILPAFVREGIAEPVAIASMPGVYQHTVDSLVERARELVDLGVPAMVLFGVPESKDLEGSGAYDPDGIAQVALRALRDAIGDRLVLISDLCLDEYIEHGHCGLVGPSGEVDNDATIEVYGRIACAQAEAGADIVAPSGMMDGQVARIRSALDEQGFCDTAILAYSAKYASVFYGPFRDAVNVTIANNGDRRGYQQDYANRREALREVALDIAEGADMVMVKPALAYLDVLSDVRAAVDVPVAAYQVSGEYAMILAASERGWIDRDAAALETVTAIKRAGADQILTYFATDIARILRNG